jgi:hypothetical protein
MVCPTACIVTPTTASWSSGGSPKEQVEWTKPDEWIAGRLTGAEQDLAWRLWNESNHEYNPRYLRGPWYLTTKHDLLVRVNDTLTISDRGQEFLKKPAGTVVAEIDRYEGLLTLLKVVAERSPGKRSDFLPDYAVFCRTPYQIPERHPHQALALRAAG